MNEIAKPAREGVLTFTRLYLAVEAAIAKGEKPATGEPLTTAYDFRPSDPLSRPSTALSLKALKRAGFRKPVAFDTGVFIADTIEELAKYCSFYCGEQIPQYKMANILCGYSRYLDLKEERITRWRLLPKQ